MKLSLRWVCDHLHIDWKKIDVAALVDRFNTSVAEIETVENYNKNFENFSFARVEVRDKEQMVVFIPEWNQTYHMSLRTDAHVGEWYLVKSDGKEMFWASLADFDFEKEGLLPAFVMDEKTAQSAQWKKDSEVSDIILDVDNKSITHRPDLWSHRGFAREIASFLHTTLREEVEFISNISVVQKESFSATKEFPFSISVQAKACKRFAALYFDSLVYTPSTLKMGLRLLRLGHRPIDAVVDTTNYVMFDIGQPLHAFDAHKLSHSGDFGPRLAQNGEQLTVLGGINLTLQETDMVVAQGSTALALAGIKGGLDSGVCRKTTAVLLESATFDGGTVRLSSSFHKIRTDASARFEKELDPFQNVIAIKRFVKLLEEQAISACYNPSIVSLGELPKPTVIEVSQQFIEQRLGISVIENQVKNLLEPLGFQVKYSETKSGCKYTITVPSYRATKDIKQPEDIVEEVGRLIGYTTIPELLPVFERQPAHDQWVDIVAKAKNYLAFTAQLREVQNYAFSDNDFLKKIGWRVNHPVTLANPLSEQRTTLVDSLVVNLLQNISETSAGQEQLGFFEWARIWSTVEGHPLHKISEQKSVAGIWFQKKGTIDFYDKKQIVESFFRSLNMPIVWKPCAHKPQWAHAYQIADIIVEGKVIGRAGKISSIIMHKIGVGDAFAFECDAQALMSYVPEKLVCKSLPKYQGSFLDISMMAPLSITVDQLEQAIRQVDSRITQVILLDMFQKAEWQDTKSLTFRFFVQDAECTVTKELLDELQGKVTKTVTQYGVQVR